MQRSKVSMLMMAAVLTFTMGLILVGCGTESVPSFPPNTVTFVSSNGVHASPSASPTASPSASPSTSPTPSSIVSSPSPTVSPSATPSSSPSPAVQSFALVYNRSGLTLNALELTPTPTPTAATPLATPFSLPGPSIRCTSPTIATLTNPNGLFAYVINGATQIETFQANPSGPSFSQIATTGTHGNNAPAVAETLDATGSFLYVVDNDQGTFYLESHAINPDGTLGTLANHGSIGAGTIGYNGFTSVMAGSTDVLLFLNGNSLSAFSVNPSGGSIGGLTGAGISNLTYKCLATASIGGNPFAYVAGYSGGTIQPFPVTSTGVGAGLATTTDSNALRYIAAMAVGTFNSNQVLYVLGITRGAQTTAFVDAFPINSDGTLGIMLSSTSFTVPQFGTAFSIAVDPVPGP